MAIGKLLTSPQCDRTEVCGRRSLWAVLVTASLFVAVLPSSFCRGQVDSGNGLHEQIELLNDPSYRVRELAHWRLSRRPGEAIVLLRSAIVAADHNAGSQMVDLLTEFAIGGDLDVSRDAKEILEATASSVTSVGRLAENSLLAIADIQERQAIDMLVNHDAIIGPRDFSLNGSLDDRGINENALLINEQFFGGDEILGWIPYLQSVDTVCLEGPKIGRKHLQAIAQIKGLQNIKLRKVVLESQDLALLKELVDIRHLGLLYIPLDDSCIEVLADLPVSESMKIYGTDITPAGFERLQTELYDLQFYFGKGGFLGVSPMMLGGTEIARVTPLSAAKQAGIMRGDTIRAVNGVEVKTFADLRGELGNFEAGQEIEIQLDRRGQPLTVTARLKFEP